MTDSRRVKEEELLLPICWKHSIQTLDEARFMISEGRKIGFILNCGSVPASHNCFVMEYPTPSTKAERDSPVKEQAVCLVPNGFKVAGIVEGRAYIGEVSYNEKWEREYRFHLLDGAETVRSSPACANPSTAFKHIEADLLTTSSRSSRRRGPTARLNGRLYMAVTYTTTQKILRNKFRLSAHLVPEEVRPRFESWLGKPLQPRKRVLCAPSAPPEPVTPHKIHVHEPALTEEEEEDIFDACFFPCETALVLKGM